MNEKKYDGVDSEGNTNNNKSTATETSTKITADVPSEDRIQRKHSEGSGLKHTNELSSTPLKKQKPKTIKTLPTKTHNCRVSNVPVGHHAQPLYGYTTRTTMRANGRDDRTGEPTHILPVKPYTHHIIAAERLLHNNEIIIHEEVQEMIDLTIEDTIPVLLELTDEASFESTSEQALPTLEEIFNENNPHNLDDLIRSPYAHIKRKDLLTLKPATWLNDEVINYYMHLLLKRDHAISAVNSSIRHHHQQTTETPTLFRRSWFAITHFFVKLLTGTGKYNYANVRRWTRRIDIFASDKVVFPINLDNEHWTILVIYMLRKELHYYDSMNGDGRRFLKAALQWLSDDIMDKTHIQIDLREWKCFHQETDVPQQRNGFDCGMFIIMCARAVAYNQPLTSYCQEDMPRYRTMIGRHILRQRLVDVNNLSIPYMFDLPPLTTTTPPSFSTSSIINHHNNQSPVTITKRSTNNKRFSPSIPRAQRRSTTKHEQPHHHLAPQQRSPQNVILQTKQLSLVTVAPVIIDVSDSSSIDSENSEEINFHSQRNTSTPFNQRAPNTTKANDNSSSDDSEDDVSTTVKLSTTRPIVVSYHQEVYRATPHNNCRNDETILRNTQQRHQKTDNGRPVMRVVTTSKLVDTTTSSDIEDLISNACDDSVNASMDADVDGTHSILFLNSDCDEEKEERGSLSLNSESNDENVLELKVSHARNMKKLYWKKKETSKEYEGLLDFQDDNLLQFPDGSQYRHK